MAGKDVTDELGAELTAAAGGRPKGSLPVLSAAQSEILELKSARDEAEFQEKHLAALRSRNAVDTNTFAISAKPGLMHTIRRILWNVWRYQHDWMACRQNAVNAQLTSALEAEKDARQKQVRELEQRLRALEQREHDS